MNLKEMIMSAKDLNVIAVEVPEWNATVYVKTLSGAERLKLEVDLSKDSTTDGPAMFRIVCATLCDEQGNLVFNYPDDIDAIGTKSVKAISKVFDAAIKANALYKSDIDELTKK